MTLKKPIFVALDSAQLGNWYGDRNASDPARREACRRFEAHLADNGTVIVLTLHHLIELLGVKRPLAEARLEFIASLPLIAWPKGYGTSGLPGGVTDILTHEIEATMLYDTALEVRDHVRGRLFQLGPGADSVSLLRRYIEVFQHLATEEAEDHRRQVVVTRSAAAQAPDVTLRELVARHFNGPQSLSATLTEMRGTLSQEVEARKDRNLKSPAGQVADWFVDMVERRAPSAGQDIIATLRRQLAAMHVDIDELGPDAKLGDLTSLGEFRQRLKVVSENIPQLPWPRILARATENRLPSALIYKGLRLYAQDQPERKGSEISDRHIATIACYADLTFVDKRTQADFVTIKRKIPVLNTLMRPTQKNTDWDKVIEHIRTAAGAADQEI